MSEYTAIYQVGDRVLVEFGNCSRYVEGEILQVTFDAAMPRNRGSEFDIFYRVRFDSLWHRTRWLRGSYVRGIIPSATQSSSRI